MCEFTKSLFAAAFFASVLAAPAQAANIDLDALGLKATALISFDNVGATGIGTDVFFNNSDFSFDGSVFDFFGDFGSPSVSANLNAVSLTGFFDATVTQSSLAADGNMLDVILSVSNTGGDLTSLSGLLLFATISGDVSAFGSTFAINGFAEGDFDVAFSTLSPVAPVPLPAGGLMLLTAAGGLLALRRRAM